MIVIFVRSKYLKELFLFFVSSQTCNSDCACILSDYTPVCGSDGVDYITPCHAGCQDPVLPHSNSTLTDYKVTC